MQQANENRLVCVQIEDVEPLTGLDEIAAIDGIDMIFFGPGDFSQSLGRPGEWEDPEFLRARERVAEACLRHGKYAATAGGPGNYESLVDMGYRFINIGADVVGLSQYFDDLLQRCPVEPR
jgi:4-hydroxy-2-oxoheptanedioate aldolase